MKKNSTMAGRKCRLIPIFMLTACLTLLNIGFVSAKTRTSPKPIRIKFMRGAISTQVRGQLTKNKDVYALYIIHAKTRDHMVVNIVSLTSGLATAGDVTSPSGAQDGQHGGVIFNSDLTESGDYTIRVSRNLMGTERPDGSFMLEVVITPSYMKG